MNRFICSFLATLLVLAGSSFGQDIPYGTNDDAGHRLQVDDVTLYASGESLAEDQIQSIRNPVLIIGGDKDFYFPATAFADAHARIANSYLLILPNCDHLGSLQRPKVLRDFVLPFVAQ